MLRIHTIPAFNDNYFWLFHQSESVEAWVVDPGAADPVEAALAESGLQLAGIVVTHHHSDHTGGVSQLAQRHGARVTGPVSEQFRAVDATVGDGDRVRFADCTFDVIAVPGHTLDHIAYHCADEGVLFCGDTLFAGGCGRLFEGTPQQMQHSLEQLAQLPDDTRVFCAHEYTLANLAFAERVEPDNAALAERVAAARATRAAGAPTVPSTIALERATNPFLRTAAPSVIAAAEARAGHPLTGAADVLAQVRRWKDAS